MTSFDGSSSTARRTTGALCSPVAIKMISRASRMVPTPYRKSLPWDIVIPKEVAGSVLPGDLVENDGARPGLPAGARLIEADVPTPADPKKHQVNATLLLNRELIGLAVGLQVVPGNVNPAECECSFRGYSRGRKKFSRMNRW